MRSTGLIQIGFLLAEPSVRAGEQKSVAKWDSSDAYARLTTVRFDACATARLARDLVGCGMHAWTRCASMKLTTVGSGPPRHPA